MLNTAHEFRRDGVRFGVWLTVFAACAAGATTAGAEVDFNREVRPILATNCFPCHGPDANQREAGLRLDSFAGATTDLGDYSAIVPGSVEDSVLLDRIHGDDDRMPPPESKLALTTAEKATLRQWIVEGANYAEHWAFVAPRRPRLPQGDFGGHPIDAFVGDRLRAAGLGFSPEASPQRLIRRASLDLTGMPPTPREVEAFVTDYARRGNDAWNALLDRLTASPRYGETMALPWLDASRFADTDGYQYDGPRHQWRWRDWVIEAYNANMPFDQFTIEQLAGDLIPNAEPNQVIATGFNRNHRYNSEAGLVVEEFLLENAVDRVDTTSTLWMGLTLGCARCHDHKYDPISQKDYYQLIAFFNNVPEAGRAIKNGNSEPVVLAPTREQARELAQKEAAVARAHSRLQPTGAPQDGGPLIDRKLVHRYLLNAAPAKHVQITGAPTFEEESLLLDGQSGLQIGNQNKALTFRTNSQFTISFWLKPATLADGVILSRQKKGTTRPGIEVALTDQGRLRFDLISRWVAGVGRVTTVSPLRQDEWVHVTLTNDGSQSANGQLVFINGAPASTKVAYNTNSSVGGVDDKIPLVLGGGLRPGSNRFTGYVRDLRFYRTQLWPEEIEILAAEFGGPMRNAFSRTKTTSAYQEHVAAREELDRFRGTLPTVMVMKESDQPKITYVRKRGVYNSLGDTVERDVPARLPPLDANAARNRLGFAEWLVSPNHPLTARVAVNRYWQKYFGTGLVKTSEDFGVQGEPPSHPELLDWLATEFVQSQWNVARMQKLILTSRTYRQQSRVTTELLAKDPDNRLLSRSPRLRLSGHAIRDQALFAAGLLRERIGGPSVSPYQPPNLWAEMSMGMRYRQSKGDDLYRRSLYTIWKRTVSPPSMAVFDAADREACWVKRQETNTPLQALTLLNETGFVEAARHLAARMMRNDDPLGFGFQSLTARRPTTRERELLESALAAYRVEFKADSKAATKLISVGESARCNDFDAIELAAYTSVANVLLNLDEVITRD